MIQFSVYFKQRATIKCTLKWSCPAFYHHWAAWQNVNIVQQTTFPWKAIIIYFLQDFPTWITILWLYHSNHFECMSFSERVGHNINSNNLPCPLFVWNFVEQKPPPRRACRENCRHGKVVNLLRIPNTHIIAVISAHHRVLNVHPLIWMHKRRNNTWPYLKWTYLFLLSFPLDFRLTEESLPVDRQPNIGPGKSIYPSQGECRSDRILCSWWRQSEAIIILGT